MRFYNFGTVEPSVGRPVFMNLAIRVHDVTNRVRLIRFVQAGLISVLGSVGIAASGLSVDLDNAVLPASGLVFLVVVWSFYSWHLLGRRYFGPYGLFLLSASLF